MRKRRRWWLQFSLRGLLVLTFLLAVGLSLWKVYLLPYHRQKPAIDELTRMGIEFHTEPGEGPRWVGWLVGEEDFVRVTCVGGCDRDHHYTGEELERLLSLLDRRNRDHHYAGEELQRLLSVFDRLPFVECVSFRGDFTDADLVHLKRAERLRSLSLPYSRIRAPGLRHLAGAKHLRQLQLYECASFTDAGLQQLKNHKELERLNLDGTQVTDEGLGLVRNFPRLTHLCLRNTGITDAGLAHLADCQQLERLHLDRTQVTDAGLKHLEKLRNLRFLCVPNTGITGEGLVHLRGADRLRWLDLKGTRMTDETVGVLQNLPPRMRVFIEDTQVTLEGFRYIQEICPDSAIVW